MNVKLVLNVLGRISLAFSILTLSIALIAIFFNEDPTPFFTSSLISLILGIAFMLKRADIHIRFKEGFAIVGLSWLLISFLGSIPFMFHLNPVDAFFESISGFTTTGASVIKPEILPKSILLWRALTQWIGGIGIIMIFLLIIPSIATGPVLQAEYPGITLVKIKPRIRDTALRLFTIYVFLTILEVAILTFLGVPLFDAVTHAFTTLSTGGYSTHSESIAFFNDWRIEMTAAIFAVLGGTNFTILYFLFTGKFDIVRDRELNIYLLIILLLTLTVSIINLDRYDIVESLRYSFFQVVSILTTTGYTTANFDDWSGGAKILLLIAMFIGGCSGSTAGGIKIIRLYILSKYSIYQIIKSAEPKVVKAIKYGSKALRSDTIEGVLAFFVLYIFLFSISSIIIAIHGYDLITSLSATAACLGNVGPGMGLASENYGHFPDTVKIILCLDMWLGRLEIYTVLALFIPSFWK